MKKISIAEENIIQLIDGYDFNVAERDGEKYLKMFFGDINIKTIEVFECDYKPYDEKCIINDAKSTVIGLVGFKILSLINGLCDLGYELVSCSDMCRIIKLAGNNVVIYIKPSSNIPGFI